MYLIFNARAKMGKGLVVQMLYLLSQRSSDCTYYKNRMMR